MKTPEQIQDKINDLSDKVNKIDSILEKNRLPHSAIKVYREMQKQLQESIKELKWVMS